MHGLSVTESLATLVAKYNALVPSAHKELLLVHGYGSSGKGGVLKSQIRNFLQEAGVRFCTEQDGFSCNRGQTLVLLGASALSAGQGLEGKMLEFCSPAKTKEKIFSKFHKSGVKVVQEAFSALVKKSLLKESWKGKHKVYERSC